MKRQAALVLVVAAAVAMVPIALGSHSASKCGGKTSVLVWPKGHGVIFSVNFPAIVNPHVEVYTGWNTKYPRRCTAGTSWAGRRKAASRQLR